MIWNELFKNYLGKAIAERKITKARLAELIKVQPQQISKLENGTFKPTSPEQVEIIADTLQLSKEEKKEFLESALEYIKSEKILEFERKLKSESFDAPLFQRRIDHSKFNNVKKIPVIDWVKASNFGTINDPYPTGHGSDWIETTLKGDHLFALRVNGNCMEPEFKDGEYIIVNPEIQAEMNDYVVVADRDSNEATFKQPSRTKKSGSGSFTMPLKRGKISTWTILGHAYANLRAK